MASINTITCAGRSLSLERPVVMGILNVTPDSFSDGGRFNALDAALTRAGKMVAEGASIIDIGGESTRPGAAPVTEAEELERVIPVIEAVSRELDVIISIDTSKPGVILEAAVAGAGLINDVLALTAEGALEAASSTKLPVCLMHMQGKPRTMQQNPQYDNVFAEVTAFLQQRIDACQRMGISKQNIIVDPGFGFGKNLQHNLELFRRLADFQQLDCPVLVGVSRKSMIGMITGRDVDERLAGSIALATLAVLKKAKILRVHDVAETVDAINIASDIMTE